MFGPLVTAMVTPMTTNQDVDLEKAKQLAQHLVENGTDTILVSGTTGESPTLSDDEKIALIKAVREAVGSRARVMAGTGSNDTTHSIELSERAVEAGADSLLLVVPYYNKPPQAGIISHFTAIAKSVDVPCLIYNIPGRTSMNMTPESLAKLASTVPNVVGVKESSGNLEQVSAIARLTSDNFLVYSGDDSLTLPIMAVGGCGVVSVASHLVGKEIKAMLKHFAAGEVQTAISIHHRLTPLFKALFVTTNPIPVKWAMSLIGLHCGPTRLPLCELREEEKQVIKAAALELELC
ncbi:MAG TPA: 4-hydroxy-tetrahydrodipicolinate synthase [Firmicutes bacterium]|jgi:4-hydroxy-tetrahydrodipicolinate synthase|nr:4-hydroxy-tetrahydrodipicolinate synthase [Bacillota bacterium]